LFEVLKNKFENKTKPKVLSNVKIRNPNQKKFQIKKKTELKLKVILQNKN
jgi:hypothetical protein